MQIMFSNNEEEYDLNGNNWMCGYKTSSSNEFINGLLEKSVNSKKRTYSESENSNDDEPSVLQEDSESEQQSEEEVKEEVFDEEPCGEGEEDETLFDPNEPPKSVVSLCDDFLITPIVRPNPTLSLPIQRPAPMIPELEKVTPSNESNIMANAKRRDVCIKSILRSMRRYYCGKLESMTSYLRKEKKIKLKHQTLIKCAQKIVTELGLSSLSENMTFYFCLFAYSCDMRKILEKSRVNQTYLRSSCACPNENSCNCVTLYADYFMINNGILMINLIENSLNKFSKKIFNKLIEMPEISYLVQHYLHQSNETLENTKEYEECLKILDEKSKEVLSNLNDPNKGKGKPDYYITEKFFKFPS